MSNKDDAPKPLKFKLRKETIKQMDPDLQNIVLRVKEGRELDPTQVVTTETGEIWVDVIAKLKDPEIEVPGLEVSSLAGQIVTGRVQLQDIEKVHDHENVLTLKASKPIGPAMR